jgi:hypothetical protein
MKKDFIVSKIEAPQDGSHYVLVALHILMRLSQKVEAVAVRQYQMNCIISRWKTDDKISLQHIFEIK